MPYLVDLPKKVFAELNQSLSLHMLWVQRMNSNGTRAEEIVSAELVYQL